MGINTEKRKYHYLHPSTGERIDVDTLVEGESMQIVPESGGGIVFEQVKKFARPEGGGEDKAIRVNTGVFLNGFDLIGSEDDTIKVESYVLDSMRKTPISFADGIYGKEFIPALILCIDLRQFSDFARDNPKEKLINFLAKYTQELLATINLFSVSYYKLLGDGALIIWDKPGKKQLEEAIKLFDLLRSVVQGIGKDFCFPNNIAGGIAQDEVYKYEIYAECSGLKYRDYIGYGINYVFRLQTFAESRELLCNRSIPDSYGFTLPFLESERKPDRKTLKGIRDSDYSDIYILRSSSD